jgi:hypothetical protein
MASNTSIRGRRECDSVPLRADDQELGGARTALESADADNRYLGAIIAF